MKAQATRTNVTTYSATVPENEITAALCELLAKQNGFTLEGTNVRCRGWHSTKTVNAGVEHVWEIEVTVDHSTDASASARTENLTSQE